MKSEFKNLFKIQSSKKSKQAIIDLGSNSVRMLTVSYTHLTLPTNREV